MSDMIGKIIIRKTNKTLPMSLNLNNEKKFKLIMSLDNDNKRVELTLKKCLTYYIIIQMKCINSL